MSQKTKRKPLALLIDAIVHRSNSLTVFLILFGLAWWVTLPFHERHVKADEKSLMIGGAKSTLRSDSPFAIQSGLDMMQSVLDRHDEPGFMNLTLAALRDMGLETYESTFLPDTLHKAASLGVWGKLSAVSTRLMNGGFVQRGDDARWGAQGGRPCKVAHAIMRSRRGEGKEAIVVVTPMQFLSEKGPQEEDSETNNSAGSSASGPQASFLSALGSASLLLGAGTMLSAHLGAVHWLAKDLVWVIPDERCPGGARSGLRQWLSRYQLPHKLRGTVVGPPRAAFGRAGVMQQAIVVQADDRRYDTVEVLLEGHNGQLPKLDLYNLLRSYSVALQGSKFQLNGGDPGPSWLLNLAWDQPSRAYLTKLLVMGRVMARQAGGRPTGPHAEFKELLVDAATARLSLGPPRGQDGGPTATAVCEPGACAMHLAEMLELSVRSLNNLVERFHHSYFLYLQTGEGTFVTVEMYIISVVAFLLGLVLQAAASMRELQRRCPGSRAPPDAVDDEGGGFSLAPWFRTLSAVLTVALALGAVGVLVARPALCPSDPQADARGGLLSGDRGDVTPSSPPRDRVAPPGWLKGALESATGVTPAGALAAAAATALLLVLPFWVVKAALASASLPSRQSGSGSGSGSLPPRDVHRIRVSVLSLAAAALSALACINWALAFVASLLLLLVAVLAWPVTASGEGLLMQPQPHPGTPSSRDETDEIAALDDKPKAGLTSGLGDKPKEPFPSSSPPSAVEVSEEALVVLQAFGARALWLAALSPPMLLCAYGLVTGLMRIELPARGAQPAAARGGGDADTTPMSWGSNHVLMPAMSEVVSELPGVLLELQCSSHPAVLWVFWGLYLPLWFIAAMAGR